MRLAVLVPVKRFTAAIQHLIPFDEAQLFVPSSEGEAIVLQAAANRSRARLERDVYYPMEETILGEASTAGEARVVENLANEDAVDALGLLDKGFRSAAILPLPPAKDESPTSPGTGPWALLVLLASEQSSFSPEELPSIGPLCGPLVRALDRLGPAPGALGDLGQ